MGWIALPLVAKGKSYGNVLLACSYGAYGRKEIEESLKISMLILTFFGRLFNTQPLGGLQSTPNSFVITAYP